MPQYRLYRLGQAGKIESAIELDAKSDDEALEAIRAMGLTTASELWQRDRMVGTIAPKGPSAP